MSRAGEDESVSGIDVAEHDRTCPNRAPQTPFRWWRCHRCDRQVDLFGGNVL